MATDTIGPETPEAVPNGRASKQTANSTTRRIGDTKYRHVFATHSTQRPSCLSSDAEKTPSFAGFRNLMILVISMLRLSCVLGLS
jgi:diacylglycerol O-acyltransferase-1